MEHIHYWMISESSLWCLEAELEFDYVRASLLKNISKLEILSLMEIIKIENLLLEKYFVYSNPLAGNEASD